jgi:sugar fermentation stimulation protein A
VADHSRLDILLESPGRWPCYVEVKNCTLVDDGVAMFPDAVTARGRKHLHVLEDLHRHGSRSVLFLLVQRMDADSFAPAGHIDPAYADALVRAAAAGVEVIAYDTAIDLQGISLRRPLPVCLPPD